MRRTADWAHAKGPETLSDHVPNPEPPSNRASTATNNPPGPCTPTMSCPLPGPLTGAWMDMWSAVEHRARTPVVIPKSRHPPGIRRATHANHTMDSPQGNPLKILGHHSTTAGFTDCTGDSAPTPSNHAQKKSNTPESPIHPRIGSATPANHGCLPSHDPFESSCVA
ncbi:MAG: hypothetical protein RLZZ142_459 [Verrucomicrobiota bacterium]